MPLPLDEQQSIYEACCGKLLCRGCTVASRRALLDKTSLHKLGQVKNKLEIEELEFNLLVRTDNTPCAFCRSLRPVDNKQYIKRLQTRIDKYNDPTAMNQLGDYYIDGLKGLKRDEAKAMALYQQSYDLGSPEAADRLYYYNISRNQQLSLKYLKEAAKLDHINACIALGIGGLNNRTVDPEYAKELIMKAGKAGDSEAINFLMQLYRSGHLTKQDLETTFRAKQHALEEVKSEDREFAKRFYAFCTKFGLNV